MKEKTKQEVAEMIDSVFDEVKSRTYHLVVEGILTHPSFMPKIATLIRDHSEVMMTEHVRLYHRCSGVEERQVVSQEDAYTREQVLSIIEYVRCRKEGVPNVGPDFLLQCWKDLNK